MCLILDRNTYALSICFHVNLCPGYKISITTVGVFHLLLLFYVWICAVFLFVSPHTHGCTYRGHGLMLVIFLCLFSYTWFFETGSISQTKTHWLPGTNWPIGARDSHISVSLSCLYVKNIPQKRKVPLSQECSVLSRGSVFTWVWKIWTQASGLYAEHFPDSVLLLRPWILF